MTFTVTYHPQDQLKDHDLQHGMRIVNDIRKLKQEKLPVPLETLELGPQLGYNPHDYVGVDTEFDDDQVWTVSIGQGQCYQVWDKEENV